MELDHTDHEIIKILQKNSRLQWKEIGELVHLSGQAVGNRIKRLEEAGIIRSYSLEVDQEKLGKPILAIVTVFMKSTNHNSFKKMIVEERLVSEAYRISGEGCYSLKVIASAQAELTDFLDRILPYGNYRVNLSIGHIK
jgi:Lrp/AsnC family transcriptional regulator, leucine-responsive regulatory protein